jgi:Tfp pilus assembly protein PilV
MLKNNNKKRGSTIVEAMIASAIIMISVISYSNIQISNFLLVAKTSIEEQISYSLTDFSDKLRTQTANRSTVAEKAAIIDSYLAESWNIAQNTCVDNIPDYVGDCLNEIIANATICDTEKVIKWDVYEAACSIKKNSPNAIINMSYCQGSLVNLCIWVSLDSTIKSETKCREDIGLCMIMEIKP